MASDGIEILNKTMLYEPRNGQVAFLFIIVSLILIVFAASYYLDRKKVIGTLLLVIGICGFILFCYYLHYVPNVYEYQVIISEDYPVTKLLEQYDIIRQEGKILILQDKEKE